MSQYGYKTDDKLILFGYDPPLKSYFCTVVNAEVERQIDEICQEENYSAGILIELEKERIELWIGVRRPGEIKTKEELIQLLQGKVDQAVIDEISKTTIDR